MTRVDEPWRIPRKTAQCRSYRTEMTTDSLVGGRRRRIGRAVAVAVIGLLGLAATTAAGVDTRSTPESVAQTKVVPGAAGIIAVRPDGKVFATVSHGTVRQWSATTARSAGPVLTSRIGPIRSVEYNPDGTLLAVADGREVSLWDATTG